MTVKALPVRKQGFYALITDGSASSLISSYLVINN